jgi:hypothetical protein
MNKEHLNPDNERVEKKLNIVFRNRRNYFIKILYSKEVVLISGIQLHGDRITLGMSF